MLVSDSEFTNSGEGFYNKSPFDSPFKKGGVGRVITSLCKGSGTVVPEGLSSPALEYLSSNISISFRNDSGSRAGAC